MGTLTSANDEWIELRNNTALTINLEGWTLKAADGTPEIKLAGSFLANGFYLLERTDDSSVAKINADQIYTGALNNKGEKLELYDNSGSLIDFVDGASGWPAGDNETKQTMSRFNLNQWKSSKTPGGTPKAPNTFVEDTAEVKEASPPPIEAKPRTSEPQATEVRPQLNDELAAIGEPFRQAQGKPALIFVALAMAIFSGIIILTLKKGLK